MTRGVLAVFAVVFVLSSCGNRMQTREAVERGVRKGVAAKGISSDGMDIDVTSVKFRGNQADAVVSFAPKGGKISDGLTMRYTLEQREKEWVIVGRSAMNLGQHTGGTQIPPSMMDQNSGAPSAGSGGPGSARPLPPGHPPLDGQAK